jgi:hypothetical protein
MPEIKYGICYELWFMVWCKGGVPVNIHTGAEAAVLPHILRCDYLDHLGHLKSGSVFDVTLHRDIGIAALRGTLA